MLDFNMTEMLVVAIVALLVIGPKDLPRAMRMVGQWVGKARGVARQFRSGFDAMVREAELSEMEKKWAEENARIMREHPPEQDAAALPAPVANSAPVPPTVSEGKQAAGAALEMGNPGDTPAGPGPSADAPPAPAEPVPPADQKGAP